MKPFILCKPYLLSQKYNLLIYIIIILISTAISILSPYIIGNFLDNLIEGANIGAILQFCLVFGGLNLLRISKNYITSIMNVKMQTQMSYDFNIDVIKHIQELSLSYIDSKDVAYLGQRVGIDSSGLIGFCIKVLQDFITNIILLIIPFMLILSMNWIISVLLIGFLVIYVAVYSAFKKPIHTASFVLKEAQAKFFSRLYEQLKYIKIIKVNSAQSQINDRALETFKDLKNKTLHNQKLTYLYSGLDGFVSTIAQILLFVVGGLQVLEGNFTIGMFTVFSSYFNMMLSSSRYFFGLGASYQQALVAYSRITEILSHKKESLGTRVISSIDRIELKDVGFSYVDEDSAAKGDVKRMVVKDFNAKFSKGKIYALIGVNGAGKSTIINLIIGLYIDEYAGNITYNGIDIRNIEMKLARKNLIGFAEQEPQLINDSIEYNLFLDTYAGKCDSNKPVSQDISKYSDILNMTDFISTNTLDSVIDERATNISGGEKQKIAILKVLTKNPDVMIFDEPTSALDLHTTEAFIKHLQQIKKDRIILIITHDEGVKSLCDAVIEVGVS